MVGLHALPVGDVSFVTVQGFTLMAGGFATGGVAHVRVPLDLLLLFCRTAISFPREGRALINVTTYGISDRSL